MSLPTPAPALGLGLDARFAASNAELVARISAKWAIVALYITAACTFLGVAKSKGGTDDLRWLALAVPSLGVAAAWIIVIQDAYIYNLIHFQAMCESTITIAPGDPDLRYNLGRWMLRDMKRQWWWQYAILIVIFISLNVLTLLVEGSGGIETKFFWIGSGLSVAALIRSMVSGLSAKKEIKKLRTPSGATAPLTTGTWPTPVSILCTLAIGIVAGFAGGVLAGLTFG